jgi:hypothetical protein
LQQALVAPVPNELILSYLRHSLAAQVPDFKPKSKFRI